MTNPRANVQLFALASPPPDRLEAGGRAYRLLRVFKHDFFAATCLYESIQDRVEFPKIVVKFYRTQGLCGLPLRPLGRFMRAHEQAIYACLAGVEGVPRWIAAIDDTTYAIEYIDARPLDHLPRPPGGFFDRLRTIFDEVHARGVAYGDSNKRSNILVDPGGRPFLIDYQISIRLREDLPWPLRSIVRRAVDYIRDRDMYHLYKHKRRMAPEELTAEEEALSFRRGPLHRLHRRLTKPYRAFRRWFLRTRHQQGRLVSPTAKLENHYQPEKATWRIDPSDRDGQKPEGEQGSGRPENGG